ncbi:MAG: PSD1 and planctomycete cytochrome C domain-containing protein [Synoicihabitans sp.]
MDFNEHILPIFTQNCSACHGGVKKSGGLSFVFEEEAKTMGQSGNVAIVPGDPAASYLIEKITSTDPEIRMPPPDHGPALEDRQIALLSRWIEQGAAWELNWSYAPVEVAPLPEVESEWMRNGIDHFVLSRLHKEELTPNSDAEHGPLLRRLSLDLTGLPPTEAEYRTFLQDDSPDAYERQVDRLLASPRFGERWATMWLDLARYADSKGLGQDRRRTMYKYRDWVIRAFNADMPYDDFTIKQIAGDLLPEPTLDDYLATAFHRNTGAEDEGGTDDEEFRVVSVLDRVNTTWQVWHGTTFGCVQCHSHPYDPFRMEEYYQFSAYFNNAQDNDTTEDFPVMKFPVDEDRQAEVNHLIAERDELTIAQWQRSYDLANQSEWTWWRDVSVTTTKDGQLTYTTENRAGREEFVFAGTPAGLTMTIEAAAPETNQPIQALRIDALPHDLAKAPYQPSAGFKLADFSLERLSAEGASHPVDLDRIYLDEPFPFFEPDHENLTTFTAYSKLFQPRFAVLRLTNPLELAPGERLRISFKNEPVYGGISLLLLKRGAIGVTTDTRWRILEDQPAWQETAGKIAALTEELEAGPQVKIPIMRDRPAHLARGSKVFVRGNWTELGEKVAPGTPASLHPVDPSLPANRLQMAQWLIDKNNPISGRVLANRFWEQLFGIGIVETLEDFGSIGESPSHPELLDYLADQLMDTYDWRMKPLLKEIVMSSTYRQSSESTPELNERDPHNRLLARGPRSRLTGEMIRDQVLALSGNLNLKMYGKPVMPPLPDGGWAPLHPAAGKWFVSEGDEIFRRSIYIHWQRSSIYPVLMAFDAPSRDLCSDRRINSNTPVQPLFTLNDPALREATKTFAQRMQNSGGDLTAKIQQGYWLATGKDAPQVIVDELSALHDEIVETYAEEEPLLIRQHAAYVEAAIARQREEQKQRNQERIKQAKWRNEPEPTDLIDPETIVPGPDAVYRYNAEQAAFDTIASVLLNLDEVLNK